MWRLLLFERVQPPLHGPDIDDFALFLLLNRLPQYPQQQAGNSAAGVGIQREDGGQISFAAKRETSLFFSQPELESKGGTPHLAGADVQNAPRSSRLRSGLLPILKAQEFDRSRHSATGSASHSPHGFGSLMYRLLRAMLTAASTWPRSACHQRLVDRTGKGYGRPVQDLIAHGNRRAGRPL